MDEQEKKISLPEIILLNLYIIPLDLIGLVLFFFGLDDFGIIDILTFPVTQFYFRIKGVKASADLFGSIVELIPYVGALPIKSVAMNINIWIANYPESAVGKAVQVAGAAKITKGNIGAAKEAVKN
ncbi:hypothetical protein HZB04_01835 [Candidatus Wolfebacteria bacterium]|nr:hypothetical protein [Candidatus Wolfebacteria bacterium]